MGERKEGEREPTTGVILAGGHSRRLQQDKRKLRLWGEDGPTLLEHTLALITPLCDEIVVVLNDPWEWQDLPARLVPDLRAGMGPAGGLVAGLTASRCSHALVVGADMPLLNPHLLARMVRSPHRSEAEALVPLSPTMSGLPRIEPLHALYARACLPRIARALEQGTRRLTTLLEQLRTVFLLPSELLACEGSEGGEGSVGSDRGLSWAFSTSTPLRTCALRGSCSPSAAGLPVRAGQTAPWPATLLFLVRCHLASSRGISPR
ncbi:MAG: molybdenum cofactor guanylyltransferase [Chloroflexaceae bacterium]|nr:molybdenum cofactor guanylyltransferase [Chloroflexaceae bacterium]